MGLFRKHTPALTGPVISSGNIEEITAQKQQVKNPLNDLVLEYIRECVIIVDAAGNIQLANPAAEHMIGKKRDEIVGLNYLSSIKLLDKDNQPVTEAKDPIRYSQQNGQMGETRDYQLQTLDSNKITPVSIIVTPTNGANSSVVVTFRDITEQLKEEEEKDTFISTASHEMRTPVASIEGYLGLALNPATATIDARAKAYLEKAHEASQHLGHLFKDLLDTTKMDDNKVKVNFVPVEMTELVKSIADGHIPSIQAKKLNYQFGNNRAESQAAGTRKIQQLIYASIDTDYLREVIDNLIENAVKYTPQGWVLVNVSADNDNVYISVRDTGMGMPSEELPHIFQKFYRIDNRDTREIGGTGLGLYLVKQRVEMMNGRIWAESEPNKGSRFIVLLPRISKEAYEQQKFLIENQEAQEKMH
jgi:PAS domain S-box-containing protein